MSTASTEKQHASNRTQSRTKSSTARKSSGKVKTSSGKAMRKSSPKKTQPSEPRLRAKVQEYLDRFCDAMTSGDTKTVAAMWAVPAFVVDKSDTRIIQDAEEVEQFFSGAPEMYAKRGIDDTRAEIQTLDFVDDTLVLVTVRWPYIDEVGEEIGEESSTYTLKADESGEFKMVVCLMRGERQRQDREASDEQTH